MNASVQDKSVFSTREFYQNTCEDHHLSCPECPARPVFETLQNVSWAGIWPRNKTCSEKAWYGEL